MSDTKVRAVLKDPRLDRVMTWILAILVTCSLSYGASTFNDLRAEMKTLNISVNGLHTSVKVLETSIGAIAELKDEMKKVRERLRWLEIKTAGVGAQ